MIQKLERKTLAEQVYNEIEKKIKTGQWKVGKRLPNEKELMSDFGISRNTLREAIRALANIGLLETKQGDGTFVVASSELSAILKRRVADSTVLEVLEVRHALDSEAVILASSRRTKEDLANIHHFANLCQESIATNDATSFVKADVKLHQAITAAAHNKLLSDIYCNLFEEIQMSISSTLKMSQGMTDAHIDLIKAIEAQDAVQAKKEVDQYISAFKAVVYRQSGCDYE